MKINQIPTIVLLYGMTAIILLITSFFIDGSLDISMHDTYFIMSHTFLIIILAVLFAVFASISLGVDKLGRRLSPVLNWFHYGITIVCLAIIVVYIKGMTLQPDTYYDYSVLNEIEENESSMSMNEWLIIIVLVFILSQLLFLINVIRAFMIKKKSF